MNYRLILLLILPLLAFHACKNGKTKLGAKAATEETSRLVFFDMKTLQKQLGSCEENKGNCARIELKYPLMKNRGKAVAKAINETILLALMQNLVFEEVKGMPTEELLFSLADSFLYEWKTSAELDPEANASSGWEVNVKGEIGLRTSKVAVVSLANSSYAGGAHANSFINIFNFDLKTGKVLRWEDIISDKNALMVLAEKKFKAAHSLPENASLIDEGYFWNEPFALSQNFELQLDGILFWYNPYEAASYSEGPTEFIITYKELGGLFKRDVVF